MRVFVTGATGFIGSVVVKELLDNGHEIIGLARSDAAAKLLSAAGTRIHRGDIQDLASLRSGAANCDAVIHLAFNHDFSKYADNCEADRRAIEAIGDVLASSDRPFVVTTGTAMLPAGRRGTEDDAPVPSSAGVPRSASEEAAVSVARRAVHVSVVRLPPSVHDPEMLGLVSALITIAREKRVSAFVGEGLNRWPAVHRLDAAHVYVLAIEKNALGARYHAVAEEGVPLREIADVIGRRLNIPVVSKPAAAAADHFGWLGWFVGLDMPVSSMLTQNRLGWRPTRPGLLADLNAAIALAD
jgi:nucleoside-diphosphate-sugar epimerase